MERQIGPEFKPDQCNKVKLAMGYMRASLKKIIVQLLQLS